MEKIVKILILLFLLPLCSFYKVKVKYFNNEVKVIEKDNYNEEEYELVLEIPKISVKRGVYGIDSSLNDVNKNLELIRKDDDMYIIAGHSGNSSIAFFKDLDKLEKGDIAYVYDEEKEEYIFIKMYQVIKDGNVPVEKYFDGKHLVLITCDKTNKNLQNIYIFAKKS